MSIAPASFSLIILNVILSVLAFIYPRIWEYMALEPYQMVRHRQYHQVVTAGFIHGDVSHLLFNMLTLFFFGPHLEAWFLGSDFFLIVYVASLLVGNIYPLVKYRDDPSYVAIGASGAVSGVVFSYCLFNPLSTLQVFFLFPIPAILFAFLYVGYSIYAMRRRRDNIGHEAHLGGALTGLALTILLEPESLRSFLEHLRIL